MKKKERKARKIMNRMTKPQKPGRKGKMKDWQLAEIFYLLVHDFDDEIIKVAKEQMKHPEDCSYKEYLTLYEWIWTWAKMKGLNVIEKRALMAIKRIK